MLGPFLQQGSVLVPPVPHKSPMQRCAEPGKMGKEGFLLQSQQMAAVAPFASLSQAATEELLWREDMGGCRSSRAQPCREPECQHVMNILSPVTSLHRRGEGNQASKGGRQERPELPGAAAPQCLSSSKRRAKVFALGIIIKDIGSCFHMPSSPLFFLINCKPHPGC